MSQSHSGLTKVSIMELGHVLERCAAQGKMMEGKDVIAPNMSNKASSSSQG